uniref:Uncharacterized protein n=1 Tax=viral metagenome TaxID=1070528 RepID=A0A6H1ZV63_9ZZZZ
MAHGTPDWWGSEPTETIFQSQDVGELAVRLGSIVSFDRRGNVLYLSSFEEGLTRWQATTAGTGAAAVISSATARSGAYSVKLQGGSDGGKYAEIATLLAYPKLSKFGLEVSFTLEANLTYVEADFLIFDGTNQYEADIRYDQDNSKLQYKNSLNVWTDLITGLTLMTSPGCFHTLKLVIDGDLLEYFYVLIDDQEASLAGQGMLPTASPGSPGLGVYIWAYSAAGQNGKSYVDDVIITQNEP